jgi:hypothetical protein
MNDMPYLTPGMDQPAPGLMQRATAILPMARPIVRYVPKNPAILIGAAAVGVLGVLAWRNRRRIANAARPVLQDAADRAGAVKDLVSQRAAAVRDAIREPAATH